MTQRLDWEVLIPRLEADLMASQLGSRGRDEQAWEDARQLLRARAPSALLRYAGFVSPDNVEDLVQNVLVKFQNLKTIRRMKAARSSEGYVSVILKNAAIDYGKQYRMPDLESLTEHEHDPRIERYTPRSLSPDEAIGLAEALDYLSDNERFLLDMRFWQNLRIAEIAEKTGKSYSATAVSLFRLLKRLRALMGSSRA
jgi:RNA polymerase sigma-70 factor (ECF subfamily)